MEEFWQLIEEVPILIGQTDTISWHNHVKVIKTNIIWQDTRQKGSEFVYHEWVRKNPPTQIASHCTWQVALNKLSMTENLQRKGFYLPNMCVLRIKGIDSQDHIFFECAFLSWVWKQVLIYFDLSRQLTKDWCGPGIAVVIN